MEELWKRIFMMKNDFSTKIIELQLCKHLSKFWTIIIVHLINFRIQVCCCVLFCVCGWANERGNFYCRNSRELRGQLQSQTSKMINNNISTTRWVSFKEKVWWNHVFVQVIHFNKCFQLRFDSKVCFVCFQIIWNLELWDILIISWMFAIYFIFFCYQLFKLSIQRTNSLRWVDLDLPKAKAKYTSNIQPKNFTV
jgi:hypothetical protein